MERNTEFGWGRFVFEGYGNWIVFVNKVKHQERLFNPGDWNIRIKDYVFSVSYGEE